MTDFYFVRHGQTFANAGGLLQGTSDGEETYLNAAGKQQARELREKMDLSFADRFVISPLQRTQQTTEILNVELQRPVAVDERLKEISYGAWDGQEKKKLRESAPEAFETEFDEVSPDYVKFANDGEPFDSVVKRVGEFLADTSELYPDDSIVVVTHGFTIKAAAINVLSLKDYLILPEPDNLRVTLIKVRTRHAYLSYYNR
ncbi:histidine phosphatase family protein [Xylocopilactobacillus apicola]|uniref:Fructose 2,6-bisphosphatase n=1 Tax=Xylocopilactobacillus apicola TaxID=2932184 RepID=A0AAU9D0D8_9LACO|nr:histidine phosphatase family protein [Xylocopilactobacillus apicola]BDR59737.1 fructose 2,6-bisphosphatase [Xylocopilactobacillus apicola]